MSKNNKIVTAFALFTTGLSGVLVGSFVANQNTSSNYLAIANQPIKVAQYPITKGVANKLSKDFISVSEEVIPAVVSITSTKKVKNNNRGNSRDSFYNDPFFRKFFGVPDSRKAPEQYNQRGFGSGVIVDKSGIILTNNHVVENADEIEIALTDKRKFKAEVVGTDPKSDVAVLRIKNAKNLPVARIGNSENLKVGEWVLAVGNPFQFKSTVTAGIISATGRSGVGITEFENFIQTDAAINPGNSGGALVNLRGEVIGINTAIASRTGGYMGIGFAIPSKMASKIMNDILTKGKVSRGFLGIKIQEMNENFAKGFGLKNPNNGIIVAGVFDGSAADKAGLKKYDVVLNLNGKEVTDLHSFRNTIASISPNESIKLIIWRDGKKLNKTVKLGELENITKTSMKKDDQSDDNNPYLAKSDDKLGFEVQEIDDDLKSKLGISESESIEGVIITNIDNNSSAFDEGIREGDIIREINRQKVNTISEFNKAIKPINKGDAVLVNIVRGQNNILMAFTYQ